MTPDYLTTNQSEECPRADDTLHNPLPHPVLKNLSLKAFGEFRSLSTSCLDSLLGACNKRCTFLHQNLVSVDRFGNMFVIRLCGNSLILRILLLQFAR